LGARETLLSPIKTTLIFKNGQSIERNHGEADTLIMGGDWYDNRYQIHVQTNHYSLMGLEMLNKGFDRITLSYLLICGGQKDFEGVQFTYSERD
jgi:hypothetical protein